MSAGHLFRAPPSPGQETGEARPDGTGHIIGQLRDATTGEPIGSAVVTVEGQEHRSLTDEHGRFDLGFVPAGVQSLGYRHIRYGRQTSEVTVPAGETIGVEVELESEAIEVAPLVVSVRNLNPDLLGTGFYRRKYANRGGIFGEEDYMSAPVRQSLPIREAIPQMGSVVVRLGMGRARRCAPILVDGRPYSAYVADYSHEMAGIEVYGPHEAPVHLYLGVPMYQGLASSRRPSASGGGQLDPPASIVQAAKQGIIERCGLILLWTDRDGS